MTHLFPESKIWGCGRATWQMEDLPAPGYGASQVPSKAALIREVPVHRGPWCLRAVEQAPLLGSNPSPSPISWQHWVLWASVSLS